MRGIIRVASPVPHLPFFAALVRVRPGGTLPLLLRSDLYGCNETDAYYLFQRHPHLHDDRPPPRGGLDKRPGTYLSGPAAMRRAFNSYSLASPGVYQQRH